MFQKYTLFAFGPFNIVGKHLYLSLLAVGYGIKKVEKCTNYAMWWSRHSRTELPASLLSLAVLAFAVDDMNARESVMTSASPCAFLIFRRR